MNTSAWARRMHPNRAIGTRFALAIVAFSLLATLVSAALHVWVEHQDDVKQIEGRLAEIESAHRDSVALSLWNLDQAAAQALVEGISQLPDIAAVKVVTTKGEVFAERGPWRDSTDLSVVIPLRHDAWGQLRDVGSLRVQASLAGVQQRWRDRSRGIVYTELAKGLVLSVFVMLVFQYMVGRHLNHMADRIAQAGVMGQAPAIQLKRPDRYANDELGRVQRAFGEMEVGLQAFQAQLIASERRANAVIDNLVDGLIQVDSRGVIERVNGATLRMFGYSEFELLGQNLNMLMGDTDRQAHDGYMAQYARTGQANIIGVGREVEGRRKSGAMFPLDLSIAHIEIDGRPVYIGLVRDLSERRAAEEKLWRHTHIDNLTELPNRTALSERLALALEQAARGGHTLAVLVINLDRFREANDALGMAAGDALLQQTASRLQLEVGAGDTLARLGADEFAMILSQRQDMASVEHVAQAICSHLVHPFSVGERVFHISASVGITIFPIDRAESVDAAMRNAEQAMHIAKAEGGNRYRFFKEEMQRAAQDRLNLIHELNLALDARQFTLVFQPVVNLHDGSVHKAEALVRWHHPQRGVVSPVSFIPLAEETGLIHPLGDWIFHEAAGAVAALRVIDPVFQVAVNTSPVQYEGHQHTMARWIDYLKMLNLSGDAMVIEITEGLLMGEAEEAHAQLLRFRDAGVQVAIDDFGTGYSSLSYLKRFDIDYLKIDQSFVRQLAPGGSDLTLCQAMIAMAHSLGIKVIAEGIETEEQHSLLRDAGCDMGQGFLFARPMPLQQLKNSLMSAAFQYSDGG